MSILLIPQYTLILLAGLWAGPLQLQDLPKPIPQQVEGESPYIQPIALDCNCTITQAGSTYPISALLGMESASSFYSYGNPIFSSANTGLEIADALVIFLYEDITTGIVSLFLIADIANSGSGGSMQFEANCLPSTAYVSVQDDAGEFSGSPPLITGNWSWVDCCTDGGVIEDIGCNNTLNLDLLISSGLNNIIWLTGDIANPTQIDLGLTGEAITINCGGGVCCPVGLDTGVSVANSTCTDSDNGSISVFPQDGIGPYTYNWSNGETTATITGLAPGLYYVTVTDAQGCTEDLAMIIDVSPGDPAAQPANLELCSENSEAYFDLTLVEDVINLNSGFDVLWFENQDLSSPIADPANYLSPSTTIYAVVDNGFCLSDPVPVELTVIPSPVAEPASMNRCEESNEMATFDLTLLDQSVSGGVGDVIWYLDPGLNNLISEPDAFATGSTIVYAVVDDGICVSSPVEVELIVDLLPIGFSTSMELCGDQNDEAVFDLTLLDLMVSDGLGSVIWYLDQSLFDLIPVPSAFITTTTVVYATVFDGICYSDPVPVDIIVNPTPMANPVSAFACDDGSGFAEFNLWDYASQVSGGAGGVEWFLDEFLFELVPDPIAFQTGTTTIYAVVDDGICISDPVPVQLNVLQSPIGNPTSLGLCSDSTGQGIFDLTLADVEVSGGVGVVQWFEDAQGLSLITMPAAYASMGEVVYAQIVLGNCLSELVPVTLVIISSVVANPAQAQACDEGNGMAVFDLTDMDTQVSGGTGQVNWFLDSGGTMAISSPDSFPSGNAIVYASVTAGTCVSPIAAIDLVVLPVPIAQDLSLHLCGNDSAETIIDLTTLDSLVYDSMGMVSWFSDAALNTPIQSPTGFTTGDTIIFASVFNGTCQSPAAAVNLLVAPLLSANTLTLGYCLPYGDALQIDLTLYDTAISGGSLQVHWFLDSLGNNEIQNTGAFTSDTSTTLYVNVSDGFCSSQMVPVNFIIQSLPVATPFSINRCSDANGLVTVNLTTVESAVSNSTGTVFWYADPAYTIPLMNIDSMVTSDTVVYAQVVNGSCYSQVVPVTITVADSLFATPVTIEVCAIDAATATIDLTQYDLSISNGGGPVFWFKDSLQVNAITNPNAFVTSGDTAYAIVMADGCISNLALIPITVEIAETPMPACTYTSIDSLVITWPSVTTDYEVFYWINHDIIVDLFTTQDTFIHSWGLGQGDTITLTVNALYNGICTQLLSNTVTCITDVCPPKQLEFTGLQPEYCRDVPYVIIQTNPLGGILTGDGISGDTLFPGIVTGPSTTIQYTWADPVSGCVYHLTTLVEIAPSTVTPVPDCESSDLNSVFFSWDGTGASFGFTFSVNQGALQGPYFTPGRLFEIDTLHEGDEVTLNLWSVGQSPCGNSDTVTITCRTKQCPPVTIRIYGPDVFCADDDPVQLNLYTLGLAQIDNILWSGPGITDPSGIFDPAQAQDGTIELMVTVESDGCIYTVPIIVGIWPESIPGFMITGVTCTDSILNVEFTGHAFMSFSTFYWELDGAMVTQDNRPSDFSIQWDTPGDYTLSLFIERLGCTSDTFYFPVQIDAPLEVPVISCIEEDYYSLVIEWDPVLGATGYNVSSSSGIGTLSGTTYTVRNLADDTPVTINVIAETISACGPSSATIECHTLDYIAPQTYIPNVFSPNGDGINDVFFIQTNDRITRIITFAIFDRWGNIVFKDDEFLPNDQQHGWDGYFKGEVMNPAVFTYIAELEDIDGHAVLEAGEVTLIR